IFGHTILTSFKKRPSLRDLLCSCLEPPYLNIAFYPWKSRSPTSPKISPRSSPRNSPCFFRKLLVNKSIRQRRRFTVAHTW
uniref:Uncharacterized protein n=1 Tax=Catharus ustulatus TaxID=91951 RepID=A0A8C3TZT1_CATUS